MTGDNQTRNKDLAAPYSCLRRSGHFQERLFSVLCSTRRTACQHYCGTLQQQRFRRFIAFIHAQTGKGTQQFFSRYRYLPMPVLLPVTMYTFPDRSVFVYLLPTTPAIRSRLTIARPPNASTNCRRVCREAHVKRQWLPTEPTHTHSTFASVLAPLRSDQTATFTSAMLAVVAIAFSGLYTSKVDSRNPVNDRL
jgi:hypothetical protein